MIESFWANLPMLNKDAKIGIVSMERYYVIDNVCHGREDAPYKFLYRYVCMFINAYVHFLFNKFTMGVLRVLNVAFCLICEMFNLKSSL